MSIVFPEKKLPTIALVGRTNVGKSALFNRVVEERRAMVAPVPGTTRTNNIATFLWQGQTYRLIDTGGLDFSKAMPYEKEIKKQIATALREAQLAIFLVDLQTGLLPQEKTWAKALHQAKLPVLLAGNKADNLKIRQNVHEPEWLKLGLGQPQPVSAINGSGVGDLLDEAIKFLKPRPTESAEKIVRPLRVAIIGRPNVGKSSLFNALIGEERVVVSPLPHTTRESHDTLILKDGEPFLFLDTAGLRRQARRSEALEKMGAGQAIQGVAQADAVLLVLDAVEPFSDQDKHLVNLISEKKRGLIIIVNKWDLFQDGGEEAQDAFLDDLNSYFSFLSFAPVLFISAKTHWRIQKIFNLIKEVAANRQKVIEQKNLDEFLKKITRFHKPTRGHGVRHPNIYSLQQVATAPPTFQVAIKQKTSLHESYLKFMGKQLRQEFDFKGTPVVVYAKKIKV